MTRPKQILTVQHPKTLLIPVQSPYNPVQSITAYFDEFMHLVTSNNLVVDMVHTVKLRSIDTAYFFTKGKLHEIADICTAGSFEEVIISEPLSVQQERNLTSFLRCKVFDRTSLILEIFERRATSAEGKLQVSLARLKYKKSRLAGLGISLSQQGGSIGTRGPGETQKERDIQHIEDRILKIRRELKQLEQTRQTQRKQRLTRGVPLICLVGYTNAGKSSLLNALTQSDAVLAENQLFSTLSTTTRELRIGPTKIGLISDTVGFIQQLPPNLIEAFKSTLHELTYAHLILHVIDATDQNWKSHYQVVTTILDELAVTEKPTIYLLNKADLLSEAERTRFEGQFNTLAPNSTYVWSSTKDPEGMEQLVATLSEWHAQQEATRL